jgi:hypothetical protein
MAPRSINTALGVEKVHHLLPLNRQHGTESDCRIEFFDRAPVEVSQIRQLIPGWVDRFLVAPKRS